MSASLLTGLLPLFAPEFDGATYEPDRDGNRLRAQFNRVKTALSDGQWWTLKELSSVTGAPEASISARLRDLRKQKFGGHVIERRYVCIGLFQYRLVI